MILADFKAFPSSGKIMGVDWGARRTGIAVTDESRDFTFARPQIVMPRGANDIARRVADVAAAERVVGIVIGLPVHSDGNESDTAASVRAFATQLSDITGLPICFIPENLTSVAAQEEMGRVRVKDIKEKLDSVSARIILENAIAIIRRI